ncbi:hypothetical protein C8Q72DRAFT_273073 [Fomitopsis betulina]|nr:hypothetical protein C8Q72DRAFT_273073 [Fomitopsis betulina]
MLSCQPVWIGKALHFDLDVHAHCLRDRGHSPKCASSTSHRLYQTNLYKPCRKLASGQTQTSCSLKILRRYLRAYRETSALDFRRAVAKVAELASAAPTYGDKLLEQELKRQEDIFGDDMRVGVPALDALLGGFSPPLVIEVSGDKGSGKTVRKYTFLFHQRLNFRNIGTRKYTFLFHQRLNFRNIGTRIAACTTASGPSQQLERPLDR